ncbi:YDL218W [Saccharomyces arboricola H-6]|uniref:YDL218W n=1 Tax=Saccharomyces arboricola (strain H-6 / AS 2.3317 / CBS 10644) TaxID=1160507 RepID=J8Q430_SACAR|nr:YDL218W [Saccharomyces arboricola H-6]
MKRVTGVFLTILRFLQFASSVLVMSLLAYAIHSYGNRGNKKTNFTLATGVISVFYLIALGILCLALPTLIFIGMYFCAELVVCMLWLAAFVVLAKAQGEHSCGRTNANGLHYNPFSGQYTANSYRRACNSSQAAIAFSGLCFLLFLTSVILLGINVLTPIRRRYKTQGMWRSGASMGTKLHRWSGLALSEPFEETAPYDNTNVRTGDVEAGAGDNAAYTTDPNTDTRYTTNEPNGQYQRVTTNTRYTTAAADPNTRYTTSDRNTGTGNVANAATDQHTYSTDESGDRSYQEKLAEGTASGAMSGSTADPNRNVNSMP